ncbi:MAG: GxxExxY protein [Opitutales bacterium]
MDANRREFGGLFGAEMYALVGCAFEVHNTLRHGLKEKVYENALTVEFALREIPFAQQPVFPVDYKGRTVGEFIPDLIAHDHIIVDTKTIERITDLERGQMLNYLRITGRKVGLILNFKHPRLEWERIILSES